MKIFICDDEPLAVSEIEECILEFHKKNSIPIPTIISYNSGEQLLQDTTKKDIVFLDIEMPNLDGIQVGQILKQQNKEIIIFIITSFSEYLDDAMRFHVFRYLSKPIEKQRFFRNYNDALLLYNTISKKIIVETKEENLCISTTDIIFIETENHKTIIHTFKGDYVSIKPMDYWEEILNNNCFFRTHKSFIVNLEKISRFDKNSIHFHSYSKSAYLTRRKYNKFKEKYSFYLEFTN